MLKLLLTGLLALNAWNAQAESLREYALNCEQHVGGRIPSFSCLDGSIIPIDGPEEGPCNNPQILNGQCWKYSRLGSLDSGDPDVQIRFLCRHYNKASYRGDQDPIFNDIALIQHNKATGATCFFQSPSGYNRQHNGTRIPSPRTGDTRIWQPARVTAAQECVGCHDSRGFLKTPFVAGVDGDDAIPRPGHPTGYYFPGDVTKYWRAFQVSSNSSQTCSGCHVLGTSNIDRGTRGTARTIGRQAAGLIGTRGLAADATPWMPYSGESAQAHSNCVRFGGSDDCELTPYEFYDWDD